MCITRRTPVPESFACLFRQYSVAAACHTQSMAVPGRLVLAKNPSQRGVCPPILRCPGLPYTKYVCAGASRLGKKSSPRHGDCSPYFAAAACHTESMAVPLRLVLAKNPSQRGVYPPILRCPGLPYTKYGCAGAPRLGKKSIAKRCVRQYNVAPACRTHSTAVPGHRPVFTGRFSVAILPEVWYNRTNVGRQVCLCGYWASIPASPLWASD